MTLRGCQISPYLFHFCIYTLCIRLLNWVRPLWSVKPTSSCDLTPVKTRDIEASLIHSSWAVAPQTALAVMFVMHVRLKPQCEPPPFFCYKRKTGHWIIQAQREQRECSLLANSSRLRKLLCWWVMREQNRGSRELVREKEGESEIEEDESHRL